MQNLLIQDKEPEKDEVLDSKQIDTNNNSDLLVELKGNDLSPYYTSTIFGKLFFNWTRYAMNLANKNPLKISYFSGIKEEDKSENLVKPVS